MNHFYMLPERAFNRVGGRMTYEGGGKGKAPKAPDYAAAARETSEGNLEAARVASKANRVDQYTPYGNINYTPGLGGDPDRWRSDISLSPTGQQLLDYSNNAALGLGEQTGQALGRVDQTLSQPFDYGSVGELSDAAYQANTARLDPEWQAREGQFNQQMANQGITAGGEAYNNASRQFGQQRNDAYSQARKDAFALMPQTYQLSNALRSQPLNELNALRTGSQVQNPQFSPVPQQQATPGANMLGAAQSQYGADMQAYNAQQAGQNSFMSGLFGLGAGALGSPWLMK